MNKIKLTLDTELSVIHVLYWLSIF